MSRLEDAEKRLHEAMSRLERALATRMAADVPGPEHEALRQDLDVARARGDDLERRMETAAVRLDATIERLRESLRN